MPEASRSRVREIALVRGGGAGVGRVLALALGASGIPVVVTGEDERALGRVVGEITCGGGEARHAAGPLNDPAHLARSIEKAREAFGPVTLFLSTVAETPDDTRVFGSALSSSSGGPGVAIYIGPAAAAARTRDYAAAHSIVCRPPHDDCVADLALYLASKSAAGMQGQRLFVSGAASRPDA